MSETPEERVTATRTELPVEVIGRRQGMLGAKGTGDTSGSGGLTAPIALPPARSSPYGQGFDAVADECEGAMEEPGSGAAAV
ncbi:NADH dehydrogenase, partial [Saccharothrix sp. ST-888]